MRNPKKLFALIGLTVGLFEGIYAVVQAYAQAPSIPAIAEVGVQLLMIGSLALRGAIIGFLMAVILGLVIKKVKKSGVSDKGKSPTA